MPTPDSTQQLDYSSNPFSADYKPNKSQRGKGPNFKRESLTGTGVNKATQAAAKPLRIVNFGQYSPANKAAAEVGSGACDPVL